jgi:hypothetical protein
MIRLSLLIGSLLISITQSTAYSQKPLSEQELKQWAEVFSHPLVCGSTANANGKLFEERFPVSERPSVLATLWSYANNLPQRDAIHTSVLAGMTGIQPWTPALRQIAAQARKDPNHVVRMMLLRDYHAQGRETAQKEIVGFLDDPDEEIRSQTIRWVSDWPEGPTLLRQYVSSHRSDPQRNKSVIIAQRILDYRAKHPPPEKRP